jgi:hypothetical protein
VLLHFLMMARRSRAILAEALVKGLAPQGLKIVSVQGATSGRN